LLAGRPISREKYAKNLLRGEREYNALVIGAADGSAAVQIPVECQPVIGESSIRTLKRMERASLDPTVDETELKDRAALAATATTT
jgi:hypothetical protein